MNIYKQWGFKENPFQTTALQPDEIGNLLLVGRDNEVNKLLRRIYNPPSLVTVEGLNGVGKTSLINVSIYRAYHMFFNRETDALYIPCNRTFQISQDKGTEDFIDEVLIDVAQTLIRRAEELENLGYKLPEDSKSIDKWLNSTHIETFQGTFGPVGFGKNAETNTSKGFEKSGFRAAIRNWLEEIFPFGTNGGVVCIIDNVELLEKSDAARKQIESLRDLLFNFTGIRWVLCGALGIIKSIVSSPRLEGLLHDPVEIEGMSKEYSEEIFEKRIEAFGDENCYLPITSSEFSFLYDILYNNIRNTLSYANEYCMWCVDNDVLPQKKQEKEKAFIDWLIDLSSKYYSEVSTQLRPRPLNVFERAIELGGTFSPSDFEKFELNSIAALRPHVKDLETVGLVVSIVDESDNRRRSIQVTPKGWFVSYAIKNNG